MSNRKDIDLEVLGIKRSQLTREFSTTLITPYSIPQGQTPESICRRAYDALQEEGIKFAFHGARAYTSGPLTVLKTRLRTQSLR